MTEATTEAVIQTRLKDLTRIAEALEKQNELITECIETNKKILAVQILSAKVNAKVAVVVNGLSILDHKEFIDLINLI